MLAGYYNQVLYPYITVGGSLTLLERTLHLYLLFFCRIITINVTSASSLKKIMKEFSCL